MPAPTARSDQALQPELSRGCGTTCAEETTCRQGTAALQKRRAAPDVEVPLTRFWHTMNPNTRAAVAFGHLVRSWLGQAPRQLCLTTNAVCPKTFADRAVRGQVAPQLQSCLPERTLLLERDLRASPFQHMAHPKTSLPERNADPTAIIAERLRNGRSFRERWPNRGRSDRRRRA
jgi:hypothetical protein